MIPERFSFWIPKNKRRKLYSGINTLIKAAEEEGIPLSQADVMILALESFLPDTGEEIVTRAEEVPSESTKGLRRSIIFRRDDQWLLNCLDHVVESKQISGIRSSFSYELIRLAKNGFLKSMQGSKILKKLLAEPEE